MLELLFLSGSNADTGTVIFSAVNEDKTLVKKRALEYNKFTSSVLAAEGLLFRIICEVRKGKRMKFYKIIILFTAGLRTGLVIICFLAAAAVLSGCGSEDKLLSELRMEEGTPAVGIGGDSGGMEEALEDVSGTSRESSVKDLPNTGQSVGAANANAPLQEEEIYVHVCGGVKVPGVYALPAGSRFYEAVEAAGGFTGDACQDYLNMAAVLSDGSRLEIPTLEEVKERQEAEKTKEKAGGEEEKEAYRYYTLAEERGSSSDVQNGTAAGNVANTENTGNTSDGLVNINTADIAGLCALPGVGEGRAKAIIEYREKQGGFQKKEDIMQVSGIGEKMYARMEAYLTVE